MSTDSKPDVDDVPLTDRQEAIVEKLVDQFKDPVLGYLKADRQANETAAEWLARRFAYDLEQERQAIRLLPPEQQAKAAYVLQSVAHTRKAQMEIIARAAELEQRRTDDNTIAEAFRQMTQRYPKSASPTAAETLAQFKADKSAAWRAEQAARRSRG